MRIITKYCMITCLSCGEHITSSRESRESCESRESRESRESSVSPESRKSPESHPFLNSRITCEKYSLIFFLVDSFWA